MRNHELQKFEKFLLSAGIRPRYARRAVRELTEHIEDLEDVALASGMSPQQATADAWYRIGSLRGIADEIVQCQELKTWPYRFPLLARAWYPVAYVTLLPAVPLIAGIQRAPVIARWLACAMLGAAVTASMMLMLQLLILLA